MDYAIGIDLGGTNVKLVAVTPAGEVLESASFETRDEPGGDWADRIRRGVLALEERRGSRAAWIGVATPGLPSTDGQSVAALHGRLGGLVGLQWPDLFQTRAPVRVLNDAQAALVAEAWVGAAIGCRNAVLLTLGTGVGSGVFNDGVLVPNTEFGQMEIRGRPAERRSAAAARVRRGLSWKAWAADLDEHLQRIEDLMWPTLFIIGGGVSKNADKYIPRLTTRTPVVPASLRNDAGIIGAAIVAAEGLTDARSTWDDLPAATRPRTTAEA